jgi:hypothetical protein
MSGTDLRELLNNRAANAAKPPADLIERVEAGHRRRRRGQATVAAFLSVLVLAAGAWVVLRPDAERHPQLPATTPTPATPRPFHVPGSLANPPALNVAWPATTMVDQPLPNRYGRPLGRIDQDHLLLGNAMTFSSYDVTTRTARTLVSGTGAGQQTGVQFTAAIAPHWIVWQADDQHSATAFSVYRAPISGGPRQLVGVVHASVDNQGYYATDDFVYWSPIRHGGVTRFSLTDGTIRALPGFEGIWSDGTGWGRDVGYSRNPTGTASEVNTPKAAAPVAFRSLVTGERRPVTRSRDLTQMQCVPTFCIGASAGSSKEFVQRLDGRGRVALPATTGHAFVAVLQIGDGGLISYGLTLFDPFTGRVGGAQVPEEPCGRATEYLQRATVIDWWDRSDTSCVSAEHHAYLASE